MIEKRLTNLSSCEKVFEETKAPYVTALKNSSHESNLKYNPKHKENKQKRKRRRNPIYYNPSYSENVQTNIASKFLHLVKKCFPKKHPLSKIFNRSKVKVSYCTMNNMKRQISKHNAKVRQNNKNQKRNSESCNCRIKKDCPLDGNCLIKSVVYQASVSCNNPNKCKKNLHWANRWHIQKEIQWPQTYLQKLKSKFHHTLHIYLEMQKFRFKPKNWMVHQSKSPCIFKWEPSMRFVFEWKGCHSTSWPKH